ncbi:vesicle transport protein SEC20-like [Gigantopelta aegis]|uniref:vesicle transport protein SEC20-like n=1 Tax=Gigantopelta aegis TaxID=1735272 RepID=UPI001B889BE6|nr:vesicle transport protein SEC20-like [Gigantopelta aegis]
MAAEDVYVRLCLQEIVKLDLEVKAIIQDIRDYAKTSDVLDDFNIRARERLSKLRKKVDELEQLGREQDKASDKDAILKNVENHRKNVSSTITSLRQANLSTQLQIEKYSKEQLLSGGSQLRNRGHGNKESLAKQAGDISESLVSLNRMMQGQLEQSQQTIGLLVSSSKTVSETQDEFRSMGGHIKNSRRLLTKYGRRELTDRLLIFLALVFFFSSVLYIVKKRLWPS